MSRHRRSLRLRGAIALAAAGVLLTAGLGAVLVSTSTTAVREYDETWALISGPVDAATGTPSPLPSGTPTVEEPGTTDEQPTPTTAPDGHPYDQWGVRLYDDTDTADDITYPASLVGDELANARSWVDMQLNIAACMTERGHDYSFQLWWERTPENTPENKGSGLPALDSDAWEALYGPASGSAGPYDWTQAGCHGRVVHEMGNDDAN